MNFDRNRLIPGLVFVLMGTTMVGCSELLVNGPESNTNGADFQTVSQLVKYRYAFLSFKQVNWDSLTIAYRPAAMSSHGDEIYPVLMSLLGTLRDGHVELRTEGGFPVVAYKPPRFQNGKQFSPLVVRSYFDGDLNLAGDGNIDYGIIPGNIGYVYISTFTDGSWVREFDGVLNSLLSTKGLIVDVRNNTGGNGSQVDFVVGRFISSNISYNMYNPDGSIHGTATIVPRSVRYQQPVVVLINGMSFSAGEMFPVLMKQVPSVRTVGDTTGGGGGSNDVFPLPSGRRLRMPVNYFTKANGEMVEWNGVAPDIVVPQTEDDLRSGHDQQLETALGLLR